MSTNSNNTQEKKNKHLSDQTHDYDGHLVQIYKQMLKRDIVELEPPGSFDQAITDIQSHIIDLDPPIRPIQRNQLEIVFYLLRQHQKTPDSNGICLGDLVPRTWRFVSQYHESGFRLFLEQLIDIVLRGPCLAGQTTRLIQFYVPHLQTRDEFYQKFLKKSLKK